MLYFPQANRGGLERPSRTMTPNQDDRSKNPSSETRPVLERVNAPGDLKGLSLDELETLAGEVRETIIEVASQNGGHLASPLGAVEMTIALHHVFDVSRDAIIWDVGHQSHAHKILTGRREQFHTLRRKGGLSGYPKRAESPYDAFGTGHSSTSISAALGMAVARDHANEDKHIIAVIGDGAMTGGMAYEALSNAGHLKRDLLVVLNDNEMSISKNVGAMSASLSRIITGGLYNRTKGDIKTFMQKTMGKHVTEAAKRIETSLKGLLIPGDFFQELGFRYFGPVDGNDIRTLVHCFENFKKISGPILFHCVTQKGKGYPYAEEDPLKYHGVKPYDIDTGQFASSKAGAVTSPPRSFTDAFASALIEAGEADDRIMAITASMATGTGLNKFEEKFPDRFFDVGICEQHAVTFAAGLATQGLRPVAAIYSTFLQRGYDQLIHDVCLQNLPVVFAIDRAGAVGEDSPTQQGAFDLSYLRAIPNLSVLAPRDDADLRLMLHWALKQDSPVAIRYGRCLAQTIGDPDGRDITSGEIVRDGTDGFFLGVGPVLGACLMAADELEKQGYSVGVADARFVKPLDAALLDRLIDFPLITVEENTLEGGFSSAILEHYAGQLKLDRLRITRVGISDPFTPHATRNQQLESFGLDRDGLVASAKTLIGERVGEVAK